MGISLENLGRNMREIGEALHEFWSAAPSAAWATASIVTALCIAFVLSAFRGVIRSRSVDQATEVLFKQQKETLQGYVAMLDSANARIDRIEAEKNSLVQRVGEQSGAIESLRGDVARMEREKAAFVARETMLERELAEARATVRQLEESRFVQQRTIADLTERVGELEEVIRISQEMKQQRRLGDPENPVAAARVNRPPRKA